MVIVIVVVLILLLAVAIYYTEQSSMTHAQMRTVENIAVGSTVALICITIEFGGSPPIPPVTGTDFGGYRPHYQGHGTMTTGGRGGAIRRVTSAASLVEAVKARPGCVNTPETCARIVVFDVSGNFSIGGQLVIDSPYITIAGQTAPNDGVTIINTRLLVDTNNVVVQHIRVRQPPRGLNACSLGDAGDGGPNDHVFNVVLDHVTCTWSEEVNNYLAVVGTRDTALLDSLIGEGLWPGGQGGIGAGIGYKSTVARNLFSQHWSRNPIWGSYAELALYNNISYNGTDNSHGYSSLPAFFGDMDGDGENPFKEETVIMNNVAIPGPDSGQVAAMLGISKKQGAIDMGSKIYMTGNLGPMDAGTNWERTICLGSYGSYPNAATCGETSNMRTDTPFPWFENYKFVVMPATDVFSKILNGVGARPKNRDSADNKMIADVRNGTGTHYLSSSSVVMPTIQAQTRVCALPDNPNEVVDESGRTRIEQFLESDSECGAQRLEVR